MWEVENELIAAPESRAVAGAHVHPKDIPRCQDENMMLLPWAILDI
jgi:hypothetical protein